VNTNTMKPSQKGGDDAIKLRDGQRCACLQTNQAQAANKRPATNKGVSVGLATIQ
jgi:hypothetical protein